jgi:hypothetical protein
MRMSNLAFREAAVRPLLQVLSKPNSLSAACSSLHSLQRPIPSLALLATSVGGVGTDILPLDVDFNTELVKPQDASGLLSSSRVM